MNCLDIKSKNWSKSVLNFADAKISWDKKICNLKEKLGVPEPSEGIAG